MPAGKEPTAGSLMEPLRVALGAGERLAEAAGRLRDHDASAAPVLRAGRPVGLLTRSLAEAALRHRLAQEPCGALVVGGAPQVSPAAGLAALQRASEGTAPGLLVRAPAGPWLGIVTRHRLMEALERRSDSAAGRGRGAGRDLSRRLARALGPERVELLRRAGELAGLESVPLFLVGGAVRDTLRGHGSQDLDLVVIGDAPAFAESLGRSLEGKLTRHEAFGTAALALAGGGRLDLATARREVYEKAAALPRVAAGTLLDDLLRRDVTINSIAIRLDGSHFGRLHDPLGGLRDLEAGLIRVHHALSLLEDPTRALRVARLAARLKLTLASETLAGLELARRHRAFDWLTGERLWREFSLVAQEPEPREAIAELDRLGLLDVLGPGLRLDRATGRAIVRLTRGWRDGRLPGLAGAGPPALLMLMLLSRRARPSQRSALAARLRLTGQTADRLKDFAPDLAALTVRLSAPARPSRIVRLCEQAGPDLLALAWACGPRRTTSAIEGYLARWRGIRPSLTGVALQEMGLPPGPSHGEILARLRAARLDGDVADDEAERRLAARWIARKRPARAGSRRAD